MLKYFFLICMLIMVSWPQVSIGCVAAPFTKEAGDRINNLLRTSEKKGETPSGRKINKIDESDPTSAGKILLDNCRDIYSAAGYDFDATIRAVAKYLRHRMQNSHDQQNIDFILNDPSLLRTPFQGTLEMLWLITGSGPEYYSGYFDKDTLESANFIYNTVIKKIEL